NKLNSKYSALCSKIESFFFQAEDGIRDLYVTGVQTCALPIYRARHRRRAAGCARASPLRSVSNDAHGRGGVPASAGRGSGGARRSEERRVGKEGRLRMVPCS